MRTSTQAFSERLAALRPSFTGGALDLLDDHVDAAQATAARADQIDALYAYVASWQDGMPRSLTARR